MHFTHHDIEQMDRIERLKLINSITGVKPANLIGTVSEDGQSNLAVFSSVIHLGSNPPLLGMVSRPDAEVPRHTLNNIRRTGVFTINRVHADFVERAHQTSAAYPPDVSEFDRCAFSELHTDGFAAPFVAESRVRIGLTLEQEIELPNGTVLIIGAVKHLFVPELSDGSVDLADNDEAGIGGVDAYYSLSLISRFAYARPDD